MEFLFARALVEIVSYVLRACARNAYCADQLQQDSSLMRFARLQHECRNVFRLVPLELIPRNHMYAFTNTVLLSPLLCNVRTSAAAAAADLGSLSELFSPNVLGGPPTVRFDAFAVAGTEAFVAGAGAEPRVRPGPSKPSLDCLPQRLPMGVTGIYRGD